MPPLLTHSESIVVGRTPEQMYDLVSDITRTGEWSPICQTCWWEDSDGPQVGAWFIGRNEDDGRVWETKSKVIAADRGREFAWMVGGALVRWGYTFVAVDGGTEVTESWEFRPEGIARFHERYGAEADSHIAHRAAQAHAGIPVTLAALKRVAEAQPA